MPNIHAPWRIEFIRGEKPDGCFFCEYLGEPEDRDRENLVLHRGKHAFVLMNRYPYTGGHLMVALGGHGGDFTAADDVALAETILPRIFGGDGHHFSFESFPAWGSLYGFVSCVAIIVVSKFIGKLWLMRGEDHYDS